MNTALATLKNKLQAIPNFLSLLGLALLSLTCSSCTHRAEVSNSDDGSEDVKVELAKDKQHQIWDAEHLAFEIETHFGKPFTAAIQAGNSDAASAFFNPTCRTSFASETSPVESSAGVVSASVHPNLSQSASEFEVAGLVNRLITEIGSFTNVRGMKLRVLSIEHTSDASHWTTTLLLTVDGRKSGGQLVSASSKHHVVFDLKNQKTIDAAKSIVDWEVVSSTETSSPLPLMEEVTESYGLASLGLPDNWMRSPSKVNKYHFQFAVEDYDLDGYLDIAIATSGGYPIILRSERGERFSVARTIPMALDYSLLVAWLDYDNDGYPDLFLGKNLYRNIGGKQFVDVTSESGIRIGFNPMGCSVTDFDCDGLLDLYVLYHESGNVTGERPWIGDLASGEVNQLWRNLGNGRFEDVSGDVRARGGFRQSFAASWMHLNDDHFPDLYIANDFGNNVLLKNNGGTSFEDVSTLLGEREFAFSMGVAAGDVNNDGSPELYVANMYSKMGRRIIEHVCEDDYPPGIYDQITGSCIGSRLYTRQQGQLEFTDVSVDAGVNEVGWAYGPTFADLNNDGWLDIYATTGYMSFDRKKPDG